MLSKMQILRGWESHYGPLEEPMAEKFLRRAELEQLIGFPSGLIFTLLHRNKKLEDLLKDVLQNLDLWHKDENQFRRSVVPEKSRNDYIAPTIDSNSYVVRDMVYWRDVYFSDDGPFEKTDSTDWDDYINFDN